MSRQVTIIRHAKQTDPSALDPPILSVTSVPYYEVDYIVSSPFLTMPPDG